MSSPALPLVSIVIPTYNHAQFLRQALESVRAQHYENWEAIVVNNYSDDNTIEIVTACADPRIQLVNFHNHGVIAASRNEGVRRATGEYVAFLDSDDLWYPEKLSRCASALSSGCDLVCHGELWTNAGAAPRVMTYGPVKRAQYQSLLYRGNCISTSATVVRKDLLTKLGGFTEDKDFVTAEDYDLWLRIARETSRLCFLPQMLGEFRMHGDNASKAIVRNMQAELAVIESHFALVPSADLWTRLKRRTRCALAYYGAGRGFHASGDSCSAMHYFWAAFKRSPLIARLYVAAAITLLAWLRTRHNTTHQS